MNSAKLRERCRAGGVALAVIATVAAATALLGCGGGGGTGGATSSDIRPPDPTPARYRPGAPNCRARSAPGTVDEIGEDIVGSRAADLVACFGEPVDRHPTPQGPCLYYRQRGQDVFWEFCLRRGRIVSASGNRPRP